MKLHQALTIITSATTYGISAAAFQFSILHKKSNGGGGASIINTHTFITPPHKLILAAKRKRKDDNSDDMFDWYEKVDTARSTPDDVFWEEMERQKLLGEIGKTAPAEPEVQPVPTTGTMMTSSTRPAATATTNGSNKMSADQILASFSGYMVDDNFLDDEDDDIVVDSSSSSNKNVVVETDLETQKQQIDEAWSKLYGNDDSYTDNVVVDEEQQNSSSSSSKKELLSEFLLEDDEMDVNNSQELDEGVVTSSSNDDTQFLERLSKIRLQSRNLNEVLQNPDLLQEFRRDPDYAEGMDRLWVAAVDSPCLKNCIGVFRQYGIEIVENFGDWEYGAVSDQFCSIEDLASFKARTLFEKTQLPCVAAHSSFEVEPVLPNKGSRGEIRGFSSINPAGMTSRTMSGYKFNDVDERADQVIQVLKPLSEPTRRTRIRSCICYYDGNIEIYEYGEVDCDLFFASSLRTFIPMSTALTQLAKKLQTTFELESNRWLQEKDQEALTKNNSAILLRDRVLKDGRVLPNGIVDLSAFMDSMVDVDLMNGCGQELAQRFIDLKPTKVLTVATTGLIVALPVSTELQVPMVYARKEKNVVMANTYEANYSSKTLGSNRALYISKEHLSPDDRVLIVDDFLSSGSSQEALLKIIAESGATPIGIGVFVEKVYDSGRKSLSGWNVPVESLVRVAGVSEKIIRLVEEEGFSYDTSTTTTTTTTSMEEDI